MQDNIKNEIIIGLIGSLGVDFSKVCRLLTKNFKALGYHCELLKVSDFFEPGPDTRGFSSEYWKMQQGSKHRLEHGDNYWAVRIVQQIIAKRDSIAAKHKKVVYLVNSLKHKAELDTLASVYGANFIALGIYADKLSLIKNIQSQLGRAKLDTAKIQQQIDKINTSLELSSEEFRANSLTEFLISKDQQETHPELGKLGQNFASCYANAHYFLYFNKNMAEQLQRCQDLLFGYPFAEPTAEEYFMFSAQAAAYRSLDVDRQVGAVIINPEQELVAAGFNDVTCVGGGHYPTHNHPMQATKFSDHRDFQRSHDYGHVALDNIATSISSKLNLNATEHSVLRRELDLITEFKRSTHAEMSAVLDAARRGVAVRDCTMYVNTYPCHNCTKHLIGSGIRKVVFLHPYAKSQAAIMYRDLVTEGVMLSEKQCVDKLVFEPFLGVAPRSYIQSFANDKLSRLERENGQETGRITNWQLAPDPIPPKLLARQPYVYAAKEQALIRGW